MLPSLSHGMGRDQSSRAPFLARRSYRQAWENSGDLRGLPSQLSAPVKGGRETRSQRTEVSSCRPRDPGSVTDLRRPLHKHR